MTDREKEDPDFNKRSTREGWTDGFTKSRTSEDALPVMDNERDSSWDEKEMTWELRDEPDNRSDVL